MEYLPQAQKEWEVKQVWNSFMTAIEVPEPCLVESQLALQLLIDRVLKKMLKNKTNAAEQLVGSRILAPLTSGRRVPSATWQDMWLSSF